MAKIRSVKPEFWTSPQIVECQPLTRLLFIGIWNFCDDGGVHPFSLKRFKMEIFPGDDISLDSIEQMLDELEKHNLLIFYTIQSQKYIKITGWHHQNPYEQYFKYPNENGIVPENKKYPRKPKKSKKSKNSKPDTPKGEEGNNQSPEGQQSVNSMAPESQQSVNSDPTNRYGIGIGIGNGNSNGSGSGKEKDTNPPSEILYKILAAEGKYFLVDRKRMDIYVERFPNLNVADSMAKLEGDAEAKRRWLFVDIPAKINWWLSEDAKRVAV